MAEKRSIRDVLSDITNTGHKRPRPDVNKTKHIDWWVYVSTVNHSYWARVKLQFFYFVRTSAKKLF